MSDRNSPGERLSRRLASRSGGLHRKSMPDGGEVYSGPVAQEALDAIGARAFTMDHTIIVGDNFDPSGSDEDAALYAHEVHHQMESGGTDDHGEHDAEEVAARAIERMVFHRRAAGESTSSIMRDVRGGAAEQGSWKRTPPRGSGEDEVIGDSTAALRALLEQGIPYDIIVRDLARHVVDKLNETRELTTMRRSRVETF